MLVSGNDPVRWLLRRSPATVRPFQTIRHAAEVLAAEEVGALVVETGTALVGVISERDIVRDLAEGGDPDDTRVEDVMTTGVLTIGADESIDRAARIMTENAIRHAVMLDGRRVAGVVSLRDVAQVLLADRSRGLAIG